MKYMLLLFAGSICVLASHPGNVAAAPPVAAELLYPRRDVQPEDVFTQDTFDRVTAYVMSWRQAAGAFGKLHLHACWSDASSLRRRYHGQTVAVYHSYLRVVMRLYERTGDPSWRRLAADIVSNILFLQLPEGGLAHTTYEHEPSYGGRGTVINHGLAMLTLLDYAAWPHGEPLLKDAIRPAVDKHWRWFNKACFQCGNGWKNPLDFPAWCGVTNQDLAIIATLARYGQVYGDQSRYEQFGKPALDVYLSPRYYHEKVGLFKRGDGPNFVERTAYYAHIVPMLRTIHACTGDPRLPAVIDNVCLHLFDAVFTADDGLTHLAWGANTDPDDESIVRGWNHNPITFNTYPILLPMMGEYVKRHPDPALALKLAELERTLAAYVFVDGTIPISLNRNQPLFGVVGSTLLWEFLSERLGDRLKAPRPLQVPCVHRIAGDTTWKSNQRVWVIEKGGERRFAGFKPEPTGIVIGKKGTVTGADFASLDEPEFIERIEWFSK